MFKLIKKLFNKKTSSVEVIDVVQDRIDRKREEANDLYQKLKQSIRIKRLWSEAFEAGSCQVKIIGNPKGDPNEWTFIVRRGDGLEKTWSFNNLPIDLQLDFLTNKPLQGPTPALYARRLMKNKDRKRVQNN